MQGEIIYKEYVYELLIIIFIFLFLYKIMKIKIQKNNYYFVLSFVKKDGLFLEYVSEKFKNNRVMLLFGCIVQKCLGALNF